MTRALTALLALPLALPALAAEPEVVKLRFAWPAPAEAKVTYTRERTRTGKNPSSSKIAYTERVERRGDELWTFSGGIVAGVAEIPGLPPGGPAAAAELARAAEGLARVVGVDGTFRRLEGVDRAWPAIVALLERSLPAGQREQVGRIQKTFEPALAAESQGHWAYAVGSWAGKELEPGYWYETSGTAESPLAPGHPLTYVTKLALVRRLPCRGEAGPPDCVELTLRSTPDPAGIPAMLEAMTRRVLAQVPQGKKPPEGLLFRDARLVDEVSLVTDPRTLLPRTITWTRSADITLGDGKTTAQRDVKSWTYAWKGQEQ